MCTKIQQFDNKLVLPLIFQFAVPSQHYSLNPIFFSTDILQNWIPKNCMILQIKYRFDYFFGPSRLTGWQPTSPLISFISHSKWWVGILYTAGSSALVLWVHGCQGLVLHACVQQWASALDLSVLLCLPCLICTSGFFCSSFTIHSLCLSILLDFTSLLGDNGSHWKDDPRLVHTETEKRKQNMQELVQELFSTTHAWLHWVLCY